MPVPLVKKKAPKKAVECIFIMSDRKKVRMPEITPRPTVKHQSAQYEVARKTIEMKTMRPIQKPETKPRKKFPNLLYRLKVKPRQAPRRIENMSITQPTPS